MPRDIGSYLRATELRAYRGLAEARVAGQTA
jgi:hypothetical protein